jgi:hypothetical protein
MTIQRQAAERVAVRRAARRAGILAERESAKPAPPDTIWDSAVCLHDAWPTRRYAVVRGAPDPNLEGLRAVWIGTAAEAQVLAAEWLASEPVLAGARIEMEACPKCAL